MQLIYVNPLSSAVTATPVDTPRPFTESCMRAVKILLRLTSTANIFLVLPKSLVCVFQTVSVASLRYSIFKR